MAVAQENHMTETVDACIIAALETKLQETEQERDRYLERAIKAEARLATAHDALHDWDTPEPKETT
jgi:hypothetical protein